MAEKYKWIIHVGRRSQTMYLLSHIGKNAIYLHRLICGVWDGRRVDHWNGNGLDNRRRNLRICTISLNNANSVRPRPSSGYKGVYANNGRWQAKIGHENRHIGSFRCPLAAALAYDSAARERWGAFARLNFPKAGELPAHSESRGVAA